MDFAILAPTSNFILKPLAFVLSLIISVVYQLIHMITVDHSLGITIILFTFIVRACMLPLMLKQQRSSRKMMRLQPKLQKIQDKYKNKTDPESKQKMSMEMSEFYKKNKANPMSGCLPLLIQMPILFALYEILRNIPFYINDIGTIFESMAAQVMAQPGYADVITGDAFKSVVQGLQKFNVETQNSVIDFLYHLSKTQWTEFTQAVGLAGNAAFEANVSLQAEINNFLFFNLAEAPGWGFPGIIWPVVAGVTTWLSSWLATRANEKRTKRTSKDGKAAQNTQNQTMKIMNIVFPFMTAFFVVTMPLGLGLYWIAGNIFSILQQFLVDGIVDREERNEALRRRDELEEKKRLKELSRSNVDKRTGNRVGTAASANRSSMAGNKKAALQQRNRQLLEDENSKDNQQTDSNEEES